MKNFRHVLWAKNVAQRSRRGKVNPSATPRWRWRHCAAHIKRSRDLRAWKTLFAFTRCVEGASWKCNKSKVQRCVLSSKMRARAKRVKTHQKHQKEIPKKRKNKVKKQQKVLWKLKENAVRKMILNNEIKMRDSRADVRLQGTPKAGNGQGRATTWTLI